MDDTTTHRTATAWKKRRNTGNESVEQFKATPIMLSHNDVGISASSDLTALLETKDKSIQADRKKTFGLVSGSRCFLS